MWQPEKKLRENQIGGRTAPHMKFTKIDNIYYVHAYISNKSDMATSSDK